ncbi:MAG: esterase-like activity of phytase family protein [Candidatus Gastranaerophilaceae bacterium]
MINKKFILFVSILLLFCGLVNYFCIKPSELNLKFYKTYEIKNVPNLGHGFKLGGFSDLFFYKDKLYAITDRGPNTNIYNKSNRDIRNFPLGKEYKPFLVEFDLLDDGEAKISKSRNFELSGLPVSEEKDCVPCDINDKEMPFDNAGIDSEALVVDKNGHFWVGDEYYPSIVEFDKNLKVINRFAPKNCPYKSDKTLYNLPEEFNNTQKNLGFESIAYDGDKTIYAFTQGPLKDGRNVKVIKFNIDTKNVEKVYDYYIGEGKNIISAATCISKNEIITAERRDGEHQIRIIKLIPNITNHSNFVFMLKGLHNIKDGNKIEGIAYDGKDTIYIVNDNDFGIDEDNRQDSFIMAFKIQNKKTK